MCWPVICMRERQAEQFDRIHQGASNGASEHPLVDGTVAQVQNM
jgi:hypothetical protein